MAEAEGVSVMYGPIKREGYAGFYSPALHAIFIDSHLTGGNAVAVLAHELVHVQRGHAGCQSSDVEKRVDEDAAGMVITREEYARIEQIYGPDARAIATELDAPRWLVEAYQRKLRHSLPQTGETPY